MKNSSFCIDTLFRTMELQVSTVDGTFTLYPKTMEEDNRLTFLYNSANGINGSIAIISNETEAYLELNLKSEIMLTQNALTLPFNIEWAQDTLLSSHDNPWWMIGSYQKINSEIPERTECALLRKDGINYSIVLLCGDIFFCDADSKGLHIRTGCGGCYELHGPILSICTANSPVKAVTDNYETAVNNGIIRVPLRKDRTYPDVFEKFGWCTWDAFYTEISSEKIYRKLDEFKEKNIPIKWIILDCGWSTVKDEKLMAFEADTEKFPEGLGACINRIKGEYGIEQVGVWHTFQSYWQGVHPNSPLVQKYRSCLMNTMKGRILPCNNPDKAFVFWDAWYDYMKSCGVDFVKVDNQSSSFDYFEGTLSTVEATRNTHIGLERAVFKHFGGAIINCMGMDMINVLQRPATAISRNSDDFFPTKENGFAKHLKQNAYNAIWHSQLHYCDYDMWWSDGEAAVQNGVLRAISGGPVYVSDKQGISKSDNILPVVGKTGEICRMDAAAIPTDDCIYVDCEAENKLLKIYNQKDDAVALAVFNICREDITDQIHFDAIPILNKEMKYLLFEYFSKEKRIISADEAVTLTLPSNGVSCYSLFPIKEADDGTYIDDGDWSRYFPCCKKTGCKMHV